MVALKFRLCFVALCSACAIAATKPEVTLQNHVEGCFSVKGIELDNSGESINAILEVDSNVNSDCPCKSALMRYNSYQNIDESVKETLVSGSFSVLGKSNIELPLAIQENLIHQNIPVYLSITCG